MLMTFTLGSSQFHQHFKNSFFTVRFVIFWQKNFSAKAACKMLVKLTAKPENAYFFHD